ncbi:MAG TPA: serine/threonine-protein kinase [Candidatus Dormibacteraeota bacterium]|nr:serine/threonine-protein kinase [Candidatus Dormibacteraeota bacterium]
MSGVQDLSGTVLKGYHLGDCLGWTSHTAVYRAARGGALWAVKVIDSQLEPDGSLAARLRRDASVLSSIGQPNILPVQDAGRSGKVTFAVTPLIHAPTMHEIMSAGRLGTDQAWQIMTRLADALDSVRTLGLVFRGLKPAHVLVAENNIYLAEFGLGSNRVGRLALSSATYDLSSPQYLSPEQIEGMDPDWRSDIYALAVLVFEILTNTSLRAPGLPSETLRATLTGPVPSACERERSLPHSVDRVLGRAMDRDPGKRHGSAWELLQELVGPDEGTAAPRPAAMAATSAGEAHAAASWDVPARAPVVPDGPRNGLPDAPSDAPPAASKAPTRDDSMVGLLKRMHTPVFEAHQEVFLNSYFAALVRYAEEACGGRWAEVLTIAGLQSYPERGQPDDGNRTAPVEAPSRLADAIEKVFGVGAPEVLRHWGRLTTAFWIKKAQQLQEGDVTYLKPLRLMSPAHVKVEDTLYVFTRNLDRIRGEQLTAWKRVDKTQFWLVLYDNLTALGRRRPAKCCYFWTAALEAALQWGGLANDWVVEEAECGCVTGTYDCVFTIQQTRV